MKSLVKRAGSLKLKWLYIAVFFVLVGSKSAFAFDLSNPPVLPYTDPGSGVTYQHVIYWDTDNNGAPSVIYYNNTALTNTQYVSSGNGCPSQGSVLTGYGNAPNWTAVSSTGYVGSTQCDFWTGDTSHSVAAVLSTGSGSARYNDLQIFYGCSSTFTGCSGEGQQQSGGSTAYLQGSSNLATNIHSDLPIFDWGGRGGSSPGCILFCGATDNSTRFISITPASGTTTATTTTVGAHVFINPVDYVDGMYLSMSFTNQTVANLGGSALDAWNAAFSTGSTGGAPAIHIPITASSTDLNLSTTTTFAFGGTTFGTYQIVSPTCYFFCLFNGSNTVLASSTTFVIGQRTALDVALEAGGESLVNALLTGSTTQPVLQCGAFSTNFSLETCLISIIVPPTSVLKQDVSDFYNGFLTRFPIGYATRFIAILSNTATTTPLPAWSATIPYGPLASSTFTFDENDMIVGGGTLLNSITDPNSGKNIQQIAEPWVLLFVALSVVIIIVTDLLHGLHRRR